MITKITASTMKSVENLLMFIAYKKIATLARIIFSGTNGTRTAASDITITIRNLASFSYSFNTSTPPITLVFYKIITLKHINVNLNAYTHLILK